LIKKKKLSLFANRLFAWIRNLYQRYDLRRWVFTIFFSKISRIKKAAVKVESTTNKNTYAGESNETDNKCSVPIIQIYVQK